MKLFLIIGVFFLLSSDILAAEMIYPSKDLAIISKEDLEVARKYPNELRDRSKKITMNYLKSYNSEFKRLNKIDIDVVAKKTEDIVLLNFNNMTNEQLLQNSQSNLLKIRDWLDFEANEIYTKYYLSSKKAFEINLSNPTFNSGANQAPVRYDSQISDLNSKITELSNRFNRVVEKAESLENQNKVLKTEIELSQKKINSLQNNINTSSAITTSTVVEAKNDRAAEYILGALLLLSLGYLFIKRGKN